MAEEPTDTIVTMLRQVHAKLGDHDRRFDAVGEDMRELRDGQEEFLRNSLHAIGTSVGAHHRVVDIEGELEGPKQHLARVEEKA